MAPMTNPKLAEALRLIDSLSAHLEGLGTPKDSNPLTPKEALWFLLQVLVMGATLTGATMCALRDGWTWHVEPILGIGISSAWTWFAISIFLGLFRKPFTVEGAKESKAMETASGDTLRAWHEFALTAMTRNLGHVMIGWGFLWLLT